MFAFCSLSCWPLSFGMLVLVSYTNGVFRLSLWLLSLKLSSYLVLILYFVAICMTIRLHQSNQAHSTAWEVLLICKYQIHSIFHVVTHKIWICFVNIPFNIQRFYVRCDYEKRVKDMMANNYININKRNSKDQDI